MIRKVNASLGFGANKASMSKNDIQIFRSFKNFPFDESAGYVYTYAYQNPVPGGGLKPAALACSKVTGKTFRAI